MMGQRVNLLMWGPIERTDWPDNNIQKKLQEGCEFKKPASNVKSS